MPPTNYTGVPSSTQPPSPTPGAGVAPIVALPNDGEPANAASVAQAYKVLADFIAHSQASSRPDVAVISSGSSGFTAPSYNAFGGTVAPSGALHHSDGLRVVIQVQAGGAVGVATFKTSIDGGSTYGATQTTAASMTDATSGITLAFAGTLTAFGTASFRSAFTPQAQWRDAAGNGRGLVDHNGYPLGKRFDFREDWIGGPTTALTATQNPITSLQRWQTAITAGASLAMAEPGTAWYGSPMANLTTSTSNGSAVTLFTASRIVGLQTFSSIVWEGDVYVQAQAGTWTFIASLNDTATNFVSFQWGSAAPNVLCRASAAGVAATDVNSGVTVASTVGALIRLRIEMHGTASPYGSPSRALYFINDVLVGAQTTNIPTVGLYIYFQLTAGAAFSNSIVLVSGTTLTHNRYLSAPAL
jgi:hypothetical protein